MQEQDTKAFDKECGKILFTRQGIIEISCCLCLSPYEDYYDFIVHLNKEHSIATLNKSRNQSFNLIEDPVVTHDNNFEILKEILSSVNDYEDETSKTKHRIPYQIAKGSRLKTFSSDDELYQKASIQNDDNTAESNTVEISHDFRPVRKRTMYLQTEEEERTHLCTLCSAAFKDKHTLRRHIERHATEKSYQCTQCPKMFYTPVDVRIHLRSHNGDRPFLCTTCGRTFITNVKLRQHMYRHTNERKYKCTECEKSFFDSGLLKNHKLVHTQERIYKCTICDATFARSHALRNHMKLHENKRKYQCELCTAAFNQRAGLFCHMKTKHPSA